MCRRFLVAAARGRDTGGRTAVASGSEAESATAASTPAPSATAAPERTIGDFAAGGNVSFGPGNEVPTNGDAVSTAVPTNGEVVCTAASAGVAAGSTGFAG